MNRRLFAFLVGLVVIAFFVAGRSLQRLRTVRRQPPKPIDEIRKLDPEGTILDVDEFEEEFQQQLQREIEVVSCHRPPDADGICPSTFVLHDGCCVLPDESGGFVIPGAVMTIAAGVAVDLVMDSMKKVVDNGIRALAHVDDAAKYIDDAAKALDDLAKNGLDNVDDAVKKLDDAARRLKDGPKTLDSKARKKLTDAVQKLDDAAKNMDDAALKRLKAAAQHLDEAVQGLDPKTVKQMNKALGQLDGLKRKTADAATRVATGAADDAAKVATQASEEVADGVSRILNSNVDDATKAVAQQADDATKAAQAAAQQADEAAKAAQAAVEQADEAAQAALRQADEVAQAAAQQADEAAQAALRQADEVAQAAAQQADEAAQAARNLADRLVSATGGDVADVAKSAADDIARATQNAADNAARALTQATQNVSDNAVRAVTQQSDAAAKLVTRAVGSDVAGRVSSKTLALMATRMSTKIGASAAKLATRAAAFATKMSNPVGWALAVFDVASMIMDIFNVGGYDNYVSNADVETARNLAEVNYSESVKADGNPYPVLFPIDAAFPTEYKAAFDKLIFETIMPTIGNYLDPAVNAEVQRISRDTPEGVEPDYPDEIDVALEQAFDQAFRDNVVQRDKTFLAYLQAELPDDKRGYVACYETMSTPTRVAVSFSEAGVQWWYESNRMNWLRFNDYFIPIASTTEDVPVALFTDRYRVLSEIDPGDASNPNVVEKRLDRKLPLTLPIGHVVSFCEKYKNSGIMGSDVMVESTGLISDRGVDPHEFGVRFNLESGVCKFTKEWCQRMGMEFRDESYREPRSAGRMGMDLAYLQQSMYDAQHNIGNRSPTPFRTDCHLPLGQEIAEFIFGTTVTRSVVRAATGTDADILFDHPVQRRSTKKTGECDAGMMCRDDAHCAVGQKCLPNAASAMACSTDECYPGGFWLHGTKRPACPSAGQVCVKRNGRHVCESNPYGMRAWDL
jgi:hypothetical protein